MTRAILFDLDNTLYPERRFALSGFREVSREVERRWGVHRRDAFSCLCGALRDGHRATALQLLCETFGLPDSLVPEAVTIIRRHTPRLRLPKSSTDALRSLRARWRIGVLTNGQPAIQGRKVEALGLYPMVDEVVFASEDGVGKPDAAPFFSILARLGVPPDRAVMVGDDSWCDIYGAARLGISTIHVRGRSVERFAGQRGAAASATVDSLIEVPRVAASLLEGRLSHAA
jgi:putative hydrolase of the HAD superfamily